ncbi:glycosyltransferase [Lysobacter sp. LF1]|uniref:Glycosyltransferase n=1 Tax=Lysobacter stagni TaxID=3045172 RepID=A0ABT6XJN0_9GAMM|nr:glycosyltransferase [Lysobacter sp. LF1]MDI9240374.1 glycosyltransferase [Lysobacter sp. LF1]
MATAVADRRIRLLLLTDTPVLAPGGSERFLQNLASRLATDSYRITLVQLHEQRMPGNHGHELLTRPNLRLISLPVHAVYDRSGLHAWRQLGLMLRRERFDVVQSQHEKADILNALLPRQAGTVHISNRRDMGFKKSQRLQHLFRRLNGRFDAVVAPARQILSGLAECEHLDPLRMTWIPNGVDTRRYAPAPLQRRLDSRRELGLDDDAIVFGCVARLQPVKRHVDLIDAFAQVHRTLPQARLVLVGDGPLLPQLRERIASHGVQDAVSLLASRDDVDALLPALDVLVLPSSSEGMSNAILEAMACGLPVVATAVGGNLHLVQHETTGLLVPPLDPISLAASLQWLAQSAHARRRMGMAARARIEREFSLDNMVQAFDQLYRRLLDRL